jgi:cytidylate kinase
MNKKHIITLTGKSGTGKSATCRVLAERLGYEKYSSGDFMRQLATERGRDISANSDVTRDDRTLDDIVDGRQREYGLTRDNFVMDGRMGWYVIPQSFKVYLKTDPSVAARRVLEGDANEIRLASENVTQSFDDYVREVAQRMAHDEERYLKFYGVTPFDETHYDLVVDTTTSPIDEVVDAILTAYEEWLKA